MRGDRKKLAEKQMGKDKDESASAGRVIDIRNFKPLPELMWRECTPGALLSGRIKKPKSTLIWEIDPLTCPKCTGEMKTISFEDKKPVVKIVPYDDGWPEYDEPVE